MKSKSTISTFTMLLIVILLGCGKDDEPKPVCGVFSKTMNDIEDIYTNVHEDISDNKCNDVAEDLEEVVTLYATISECPELIVKIEDDGYDSYEDFIGNLRYNYHPMLAGYCGNCENLKGVMSELQDILDAIAEAAVDENCGELERRIASYYRLADSVQYCEELLDILKDSDIESYEEFKEYIGEYFDGLREDCN